MVKLSCTVNVQYGVFCFNEAWLNSVNEQFNSHCKLGLKAPELIHFKLYTKTGLKIRVGNSLIGFSSNLLVKKSKSLPSLCSHERFAHSCSFVKRDMTNCSRRSLKKSNWVKSNMSDSLMGIKRGKEVKNCLKRQKIRFFPSESLVFESISLKSWANHSCCSFFMSDLSELLKVFLLSWATWANRSRSAVALMLRAMRAICSRLLFCHERPKQ